MIKHPNNINWSYIGDFFVTDFKHVVLLKETTQNNFEK